MIEFLLLLTTLAIASLLLVLVALAQEQRGHSRVPSRRSPTPQRRESRDSPLKRKAIGMLYGDVSAAERLFNYARRPGKSEDWIWQQVIDDLVRDRR